MNGMSYLQKTFTFPASNGGTSQWKWDLIFLTDVEFQKKYRQPKPTV
jgi:hypothetical protein